MQASASICRRQRGGLIARDCTRTVITVLGTVRLALMPARILLHDGDGNLSPRNRRCGGVSFVTNTSVPTPTAAGVAVGMRIAELSKATGIDRSGHGPVL